MSLAAALSDLQVEYVGGVTDVDRKYLPPDGKTAADRDGKPKSPNDGSLFAWRAHMNVLRT